MQLSRREYKSWDPMNRVHQSSGNLIEHLRRDSLQVQIQFKNSWGEWQWLQKFNMWSIMEIQTEFHALVIRQVW